MRGTRADRRPRLSGVALLAGLLAAGRDATAGTFTRVAVHPDAVAQPTATGRVLIALEPFNGRLYAGFGDYTANTGPIAIRAFDPVLGDFGPSLLRQATEAIYEYREIGGRLLAPHTDPIAGESSGGFAEVSPAVPEDSWRDRLLVTGVHFYDVATLTGADLWLSGSRGSAAALWRSLDGGQTWVDVPELSQLPATGFSRYYFVAAFQGKLWVQASGFSTSKVFDGASWSDGPDLLPAGGYGWHPEVFAGQLVYQTGHAGLGASTLMTFDGSLARRLLGAPVFDFSIDEGTLQALPGRYVAVPGSSAGGYYTVDAVLRTPDLCTWERMADTPPTQARSLAVLQGSLYLGALDAELYRHSDPLLPIAPGLPLEIPLLHAVKRGADVALSWVPRLAPGGCETYTTLASDSLPAPLPGDFSPRATGLPTAAWSHVGAVDDGGSHAYLVQASSPNGSGPTGR